MTAEEYLRRVEFWLRDLPWRQRRQLLAEIRDHLAELPARTDLVELGTPEDYAAELRSAAGLERRRGPIAFLRARRPRNVILIVLAATLVGLAIGVVAWVDSYQPLVFGDGAQYPPAAKGVVGSDAEQVAFRQGAPFEAGVSVVNAGRFTVRVLGGLDQTWLPLHARLYLAGPMANHGGFPRPHKLFHPFDLAPGQVAFLVLRGTFDARCQARTRFRSYWEVGVFPVRFSFLWRTATTPIALPSPLEIAGPKGMSCKLPKR